MKKIILFAFIFYTAFAVNAFGKTVSGIITMDFDLSGQAKGKEVKLWIPHPVSDSRQNISMVNITGDYVESTVSTDKIFKTPILFARWGKDATKRRLSFSFRAQRDEVTRPAFPEKEMPWNPDDYAIYLSATQFGPIDGDVKKLADKITRGKTGVLAKAKAIYDWTVENTYRNPKTRGCGTGDVCSLLKDPGGKCTDISSVYVALARAAGVASREISGIRMGKKVAQDITTWQHCWAEFFLPGYGWVSVDPADVRKMMLVYNLKLSDPKIIEFREYFWGGIDPYRIKLGQGRDLILNPPHHGPPVNYLMYPFAQVGEESVDWLDPASFKYAITFNQVSEDGYGLIDTDNLKKFLDFDPERLVVIDARNPEEYREVHVKGAISLPQKKFFEYAHLLPEKKNARIIFYCNGVKCSKSRKAAKMAMEIGYSNVFVYDEGMPVWEEKGMPIYAGPDYEKRIETTKILPADLNLLLGGKEDSFTIVDVRDNKEYGDGHIPGAINIPLATFASQSKVLDKEKKIIVYCNSGGRSYNAYRKLVRLGYKNIYQAIFYDWKKNGYQVQRSNSQGTGDLSLNK